MYKQTLIADEEHHSIDLPEEFYGKKVEITIVEVADTFKVKKHGVPPPGKKVDFEKLSEGFGTMPDFPSIEEIRAIAWS